MEASPAREWERERKAARRSPWIVSILALLFLYESARTLWRFIGIPFFQINVGPVSSHFLIACVDPESPRWKLAFSILAAVLFVVGLFAAKLPLRRLRSIARAFKLFWLGVILGTFYPVHSLCNCLDYLGASDRLVLAPLVLSIGVVLWQLVAGWRERRAARAT